MAIPLVDKFYDLAVNVLLIIDHSLHDQNIIESILETYTEFCRSDVARRLNISEMPITDEMRTRLRYECLCYSAFNASLLSSKYLAEKKLFIKRPNQRAVQLFDEAVAAALIDLCNNLGMIELREIELRKISLAAIAPKPIFGLGDHLDPLNRLETYRYAFLKERGSELEQFGKYIGKALDAPRYPTFEIIGGTYGKALLMFSDYAMASVLKRDAMRPLSMKNEE